PKTHRIKAYRKYAKHVSEDLYRVFRYPCTDSEENRLFKILNDAYIDARYKDDYFIAPNDLKKLISKVDKLEEIVIRLCEQRIVQL
ncbi:MAG: HEPN domain-containing protein, partial [Sphingobacterium sp.]